jgi:hypothetical protein
LQFTGRAIFKAQKNGRQAASFHPIPEVEQATAYRPRMREGWQP